MAQRKILIAMLVGFSLSLWLSDPGGVVGQDSPSVQQLFDQAMGQYASGEFLNAQQSFRRIDPLQLDKKQRLIMYETIQNIDRHIRQDTTPDKMLKEAIASQNSGKLSRAMALFQSVSRHHSATTAQKQDAEARLADVKRRLNAELTRARRSIDEAATDIQAGRYQAAERKLRAVKESGLDMGWFENERVDRQLMIISERLAANRRRQPRKPRQTPPTTTPPDQTTTVRKPPTQQPPPGPSQRDLELAQQERELARRQQQLEQKEQALREQTLRQQQQDRLAQREREVQEQARQEQLRLQQQAQAENELAERQRQLEQRQQQLAQREQALRQQAQREKAQQDQALRDKASQDKDRLAQELAQRERELELRQQRLAQREQALRAQAQQGSAQQRQLELNEQARRELEAKRRRSLHDRAEQERIAQRERELAQQRRQGRQQQPGPPPQRTQQPTQMTQRELEMAQREKQLAQWERQLAQREQQPPPGPTRQPPVQPGMPPVGTPGAGGPTIDILYQARALRVQEKLAQAHEARESQQHHLATRLYQEVLQLDPANNQARMALASDHTQANLESEPKGVLETEIQARTIRSKAAVAEFEALMSRATNLLNKQSFTAARESVQQAKITLDLNQRFLPTARYRTLRDNAVSLAAQITDAQRLAEEAQKREVEIARRTEAEKRRAEALIAQREETQRLLLRASKLRREQNFSQALELLNQALFLDPQNIAAQAMKEMIQDNQIYVEARDKMRERNLLLSNQSNQNLGATLPFTELMTYPADWPRLTASRLGGADPGSSESEINRRVALKLKDSVPINFESNRLVNIIEYLRNTTGVNFFVNWPVLETVGIGKDLPVTLQLNNVPVDQALRLVLQQASAASELEPISFSVIEGVVTISTERDLSKTTDIRPYDIRDLLVQVPNFTEAPEFDLNAALSNTNSGGSQGGGGGGGGAGGLFAEPEVTEEQRTRKELIDDIVTLIVDTVGKQGDWERQGGEGGIQELNGNLIVKSTPQNHRQIAKLLSQLRETRAIQIAVEGRFLLVDQNFLDEFGVDLDVTFNNGDPDRKWGPVTVGQSSSTIAAPETHLISPASFKDGLSSFTLGASYLSDIEVSLMIKATQASRRAITLTAPRLTLFNGQRAYVIVARQISFISDLEPIPDGGGFDTTLSVVNSGVILDVEGTVSADRRYVTMTLRPSLATLIPDASGGIRKIAQTATIVIGTGNAAVPLTIDAFIEAPELEITSVKTSVSVPDRGTLLIGGQRIVADSEIEVGVPVLSKIPVLNRLFTNTSKVQDERTLLILIKPTILIQSEEEEQNFPGLLQNPQKYGIGQRF